MRAGTPLSLSFPAAAPQRPYCFIPFSPRTHVFRDSSPEDLGLWAFGIVEDANTRGQPLSPGVQWAGDKKDARCWHQDLGQDGPGQRNHAVCCPVISKQTR